MENFIDENKLENFNSVKATNEKKKVELLSPVGDFDCLKAAVQNGADTVYFGASSFNARSSAKNFDFDELKKAIDYAKTYNVKTNLTLNILIKDNEFNDALEVASKAYEYGIDAIIVQDLGLAQTLIENFPDLQIHASTQMTIHNLEGAQALEKLGFSRVVLSRELSIDEITYICNNTNIEVETFIHGALCISYSGQCLLSSMIGGRSGNRGKCAQPCRLPYELIEEKTQNVASATSFTTRSTNVTLDNGYLLSTRDLCGLKYIPKLLEANVDCFKIEGRMKTPEYVATVTRIYRKYIDLALSNNEYVIDNNDLLELMQVFNRGGFSDGHLSTSANRDLVYKEKQNNMGLYIGNVSNYNSNKSHITLKLLQPLHIGDGVSFEKENTKYNVSELMNTNNQNIKETHIGDIVKIGRMKGNINPGDKIFKLTDKELLDTAKRTYSSNPIKKIPLNIYIIIKKDCPVSLTVTVNNDKDFDFYKNCCVTKITDIIPEEAINKPLTKERVIDQLSRTKNTPYEFVNFNIDLDDNVCIPQISVLNEVRREVIEEVANWVIKKYEKSSNNKIEKIKIPLNLSSKKEEVSILLQILNNDLDYSELKDIDNVYIPLKYFTHKQYAATIKTLCSKFNVYIYMPTIIKANYKNLFLNNIEDVLEKYKIIGFVLSNIADFELLDKYSKKYKFIGNYTLNSFNNYTIAHYAKLGLDKFTVSPEESKSDLQKLISSDPCLNPELMVYGNIPIMNMGYCLLGKSNKCYPECKALCMNEKSKYYLKDRLGFLFRIIPDNHQTITAIYNSKTTSLDLSDLDISKLRINLLDESIEEINTIVFKVRNRQRFEGKEYTNGNFNREV